MKQTSTNLLSWLVDVRLLYQPSKRSYTLASWLSSVLGYATGKTLPAYPPLLAGNKLVIGLTGNIAMGKSTVLNMASRLGAETIDADALVHDLREPDAAGYQPLIDLLGAQILLPDERINVKMLGQMAFADKRLLDDLGKLFRPLVVAEIKQRIIRSDDKIVFIEAIRLVDGQLRHSVDEIWVVNTSRETQIHRLMAYRGLTEELAMQRIDAQPSQQIKLDAADVIIDTDGTVQRTRQQVLAEWQRLLVWGSSCNVLTYNLLDAYLAELIDFGEIGWTVSALITLFEQIATTQSAWGDQDLLDLIDAQSVL